MIASMVLYLKKTDDMEPGMIYPYFIHGWIYSKIRQIEVGQYYHEAEKSPFAMKSIVKGKQEELFLQLIFFDYRVLLEFYRGLIRGGKIRLGSHFYIIERFAIHPEEHPKARMVSYESFAQLPVSSKVIMKFKHTAFKHDNKTIVLPIPENIVGSILRKWNDASGQPLTTNPDAELIRSLASGMLIHSHNIDTQLYFIRPDIRLTTFSGKVVIENIHRDSAMKHLLNLLLHFSNYSGIGWKCSYGMGCVDVVSLDEQQQDMLARKEAFSF